MGKWLAGTGKLDVAQSRPDWLLLDKPGREFVYDKDEQRLAQGVKTARSHAEFFP